MVGLGNLFGDGGMPSLPGAKKKTAPALDDDDDDDDEDDLFGDSKPTAKPAAVEAKKEVNHHCATTPYGLHYQTRLVCVSHHARCVRQESAPLFKTASKVACTRTS